jgi:hypothetical protein
MQAYLQALHTDQPHNDAWQGLAFHIPPSGSPPRSPINGLCDAIWRGFTRTLHHDASPASICEALMVLVNCLWDVVE